MRAYRGKVALALYPFSSGEGRKNRPVLVIQNDQDNQRRFNTIVVQITSNLQRVGSSTHFLVEVKTPEGQLSGLLQDSLIACGNLATIAFDLIDRVIGHLPSETMAKIDDCLRIVLGLS